jgi:hypothetical protein
MPMEVDSVCRSVLPCLKQDKNRANAERNGQFTLYLKDCFKTCFCHLHRRRDLVQLVAMCEFLKVLTFAPSSQSIPDQVHTPKCVTHDPLSAQLHRDSVSEDMVLAGLPRHHGLTGNARWRPTATC